MPTVLIVEDEVQILLFADTVLRRAGYQTLTAATVAEAQAIISSGKELDLVFTDVMLANHREGGLTIGQLVKRSHQAVPVLYTTGRELTQEMKSIFNHPAGFLPKPYSEDALAAAVAKIISE
jgi:CheY-like chemotaxis protein